MEFTSFEEALRACVAAADGSPEQEAGLAHCLQYAPPELRSLLARRLASRSGQTEHGGECGCGCGGETP